MKHLGDITKIHGFDIEPVECIVGGSPCQDLSVAGKRAGLAGERSGLFMEQVRIVKEMRVNDILNGRDGAAVRPRFLVWENVAGAFSSNGCEDFRAVLEEIARIAEPDAVIPRPPKGKWYKAGIVRGNEWSISWRTHDAQYWGVPQRRRRIALVADFAGQCSDKILFEQEGVRGDYSESERTGKETSRNSESSVGVHDKVVLGLDLYNASITGDKTMNLTGGRVGVQKGDGYSVSDKMYTLNTVEQHAVAYGFDRASYNQGANAKFDFSVLEDQQPTLTARGPGAICYRKTAHPINSEQPQGYEEANVSDTLNTTDNSENRTPTVVCEPMIIEPVISMGHDARNAKFTNDGKTDPLTATDYKEPMKVAYKTNIGSPCATDCKGIINYYVSQDKDAMERHSNIFIVRRLTPLECERLQGFPDGWTDIGEWSDSNGKIHKPSDSPRYKALGNSIALPFWQWMFARMANYLPEKPKLGSLFDGIGGFPLCWERIHGKGLTAWASEIEDFCIAVTKKHFGQT